MSPKQSFMSTPICKKTVDSSQEIAQVKICQSRTPTFFCFNTLGVRVFLLKQWFVPWFGLVLFCVIPGFFCRWSWIISCQPLWAILGKRLTLLAKHYALWWEITLNAIHTYQPQWLSQNSSVLADSPGLTWKHRVVTDEAAPRSLDPVTLWDLEARRGEPLTLGNLGTWHERLILPSGIST